MIVSHKHRFIFIKTHKTAGTSVEISLSRFCGPSDVITRIRPQDEAVRRELGKGPQNDDGPLWKYRARDVKRLLTTGRRNLFYNHMPAHRVRRLVGRDIWDEYFTFCFERNPWDKVVSAYYWDQRERGAVDAGMGSDRRSGSSPGGAGGRTSVTGDRGPSFSAYLSGRRRLNVQDFPLYAIDGKVAVDRVGRFENLADDLADICRRIGIDFDGWLPRVKGGFRDRRQTYQKHYGAEERALVARRFHREIELFGYRFDPT